MNGEFFSEIINAVYPPKSVFKGYVTEKSL